MSKKDYIKIARILRKHFGLDKKLSGTRALYILMTEAPKWKSLVNDFCEMFQADNPNFDADRFRRAVVSGGGI